MVLAGDDVAGLVRVLGRGAAGARRRRSARARATGDGVLWAVGHSHRGLLNLRRGDLMAAEADARQALETPNLPAPVIYRNVAIGVLVESLVEQRRLADAEAVLEPFGEEIEAGMRTAAFARTARGRLRVAQRRLEPAIADFLAAGDVLTRCAVTCPGFVPWRSQAAIALGLAGEDEHARELAEQEVGYAREFAAPRALGVALHAAGVVAAGDGSRRPRRDAAARRGLRARGRRRARRPRARPGRPRRAPAPRQPARRGARPAARGARHRPPRRRARDRRARRGRAARHRRASPAHDADRPGGADRERAARRRARRRGPHQPADRAVAVHHPPHRRGPPHAGVLEARRRVAPGAPGRARPAGRRLQAASEREPANASAISS